MAKWSDIVKLPNTEKQQNQKSKIKRKIHIYYISLFKGMEVVKK